MAELSQMVANGKPSALKLVKKLLDSPMLINLSITADGLSQGLPFAIPLETETHQQTGSAEVSESLVIAATGKKNVCDNVAPGAWTWNLSGYIPGMSALEKTNLFTPFVTLNTQLIKNAFKKGYVLIFKDIDCQIYKRVVIQSLTLSPQKDCRNKMPFSMTLKEINVITGLLSDLTESAAASAVAAGSALGSAAATGTVVATSAAVSAVTAKTKVDDSSQKS